MTSHLILIVDMQRYKLYRTKTDPMERESVELLESIDSIDTHDRIRDQVSDRQGNFHGVGSSGSGEDHNLPLENERRRIAEIASQIAASLKAHPHESWSLAAPKTINHAIIEALDASCRDTLEANVVADLTKIPDNELLSHFA